MRLGGFEIRLDRVTASRLISQASTQVLTAVAVAVSYKRAFRMSREFRRLPG